MLLRKLFRTAWGYKSQFISMIIMIAIGVGVFMGFNIEWRSIEADTGAFFDATSYADYRIYSETGFTSEDVACIRRIDAVEAATRFLSVNVGIKNSDKNLTLNVSESYNVSTMLVTDGSDYDESSDGVWLSDRFAEENGIAIGDRLTVTYKGAEIGCEVVGLCKSGENMICTADSNQLMPDYEMHGFAYITPGTLERAFGASFYPQINIISQAPKEELEEKVGLAVGKTLQIVPKELHTSFAGAQSEAEEGKTMGSVLPVLFLAIAVLTMVTTMHRIASNEKVQIGTLKALGFRDSRILAHYTSYGLVLGIVGGGLGVALGYGISAIIMSPGGMMATYFDLPEWRLVMPWFCIPVLILTVVFLTLISFLSTKEMLRGTAADALRPYTPPPMKKAAIERLGVWSRLPFSVKWNVRDILRHKARSAMTLLGVFGCMVLIVGGLGMSDTMDLFLDMIDDTSSYSIKVILSETASNDDAVRLSESLDGGWQASQGVSYDGKTVTLDIYGGRDGKISILSQDNEVMDMADDGVYLCLRLKDTANIGDTIEISPYGEEETYRVRVAGYFRSLISESIAMSDACADELGLDYHIGYIYTDRDVGEIADSELISGKQDKATIMASYDTFMELMNMMVLILIFAAVVLGVVVLYSLGVMSYAERRRELATLKVLGFRDRAIGRILISQNIWLTLIGILIGAPGGAGVLYVLVTALASEYELSIAIDASTYAISILLTFGVSLLVGAIIARKNKKIDMVEALKGAE